MLNTTGENVEIITTRNNKRVTDEWPRKRTYTAKDNESSTLTFPRRKRVRTQIKTGYLNKEKKKTIKQICKDFNDIFHLEGDLLTHTTAVAHEINTRIDSASVNVRPYRLPEKHKEEVN